MLSVSLSHGRAVCPAWGLAFGARVPNSVTLGACKSQSCFNEAQVFAITVPVTNLMGPPAKLKRVFGVFVALSEIQAL